MNLRRLMVIVLLAACTVPSVRAQTDTQDWKRWTVRYFNVVDLFNDFNASGLVGYLEENGFGGSRQSLFGGTLDYPLTSVEGGTGWSVLAAYAYRPWLKVGGSFHHAAKPNARGLRNSPNGNGRVGMSLSMWAVAPLALWTPTGNVAVGAGPAVLRGTVTLADQRIVLNGETMAPQETSFLRLGAVAFASLGFTLFKTLYVGVQGQYLYGGEAEVGPFHLDEDLFDLDIDALEAGGVRLNQFTVGPVVAVNF